MKNKLIKLRTFLDQQEEGDTVPFDLVISCKLASDEADKCAKSVTERNKQTKHFQGLLKTDREEAKFIRLLFLDLVILSL